MGGSGVNEEERRKRFRMRCWRRGMKEMDLILGPFADAVASGREIVDVAVYETLIEENDLDLYAWISGAVPTPDAFAEPIERLRTFASNISH